jgi:hypothetical protein
MDAWPYFPRLKGRKKNESLLFFFDYLVASIINRYGVRLFLSYAVDCNCFLSPFFFIQSGFIKLLLICRTTADQGIRLVLYPITLSVGKQSNLKNT